MRLSELLASEVVDELGERVGPVRDVRILVREGGRWEVSGLVVGDGSLASAAAHRWGYAEGRASGPALLRRLLAGATGRSRFVAAELVSDWGPGRVRLRGSAADLAPAAERGRR